MVIQGSILTALSAQTTDSIKNIISHLSEVIDKLQVHRIKIITNNRNLVISNIWKLFSSINQIMELLSMGPREILVKKRL